MDGLILLRIFLVLLMLGVALYALNDEVECWCNDSYAKYKSKYDRILHHITDDGYTIPQADRQPTESMKDLESNQQSNLVAAMMRTRLKFKQQNHVGSVMKDGFNADLPENAMWKGGTIVVGEDIRQLVQKAIELANPPMSLPSPTPH